MQKSPTNKSLSWELLAAGSPLLLFAAASGLVLPGMLQQYLPDLLRLAAMGCLGTAGVMGAHDYISSNPVRQLKVAFEKLRHLRPARGRYQAAKIKKAGQKK